MRANTFWVSGPWRGRLGIVLRPRGGDWLIDEMKAWRQSGIDHVVSLLEADEQTQLDLQDEARAAADNGLAFTGFPVPDRGVPASDASTAALVRGIIAELERGRTVVVHCRQSVGRSALLVGAVLVAEGDDVRTALETIQTTRGLAVPETDEQRQWLRDFATREAHESAAQHRAPLGRRR